MSENEDHASFMHLVSNLMMMESFNFPPLPDNSEESETDWSYVMRRQMQEIMPGLFLGPYAAANKSKLKSLEEHGITHILCIRHIMEANFIKPNFADNFRYLVLEIADSVTENIIQYFPRVKQFLDDCLHSGGHVLVHGNAGISRSAALVIAYVMEKYGLQYREALRLVQTKRFCVFPNEGFARQLMEYEPIYQAKLSQQNGQTSEPKGEKLKRKIDEIGDDMDTGQSNSWLCS